jgi:Zn-finger nucleic acid-binding protein
MTDRQGIEIDYCPQCRGVWLDRGELDKILERSASLQAPPRDAPPRPEYRERERDRDDDAYRYRKRKNWLEELFD